MISRHAIPIIISLLAAFDAHAQNGWVAMNDTLGSRVVPLMACDSTGRIYALVAAGKREWKGQSASYYNLYRANGRDQAWEVINQGTLNVGPLFVSPLGSVVVGGLDISTWPDYLRVDDRSIYRGVNDTAWSEAGGTVVAADLSNPGLYAVGIALSGIWSTNGGAVIASRDGGRTWSHSQIPVAVRDLCVTPSGEIVVGAANEDDTGLHGGAIYRSTDSGATWSIARDSINVARIRTSSSGSLFVDAVDWSIDIAGSRYDGGTMFRSSDGGATWSSVIDLFRFEDLIQRPGVLLVHGLARSGPGRAYYRSTDDGLTWERMTSSITPFTRRSSGTLYGYDAGGAIYRSEDGEMWMAWLPPPPYPYSPRGVAIDPDGYLYVGTGAGIYRSELSSSVERAPHTAVDGPRLDPVTPNPAGHRAAVGFTMPVRGNALLELHDMLGRRVAVLHDGEAEAGEHHLTLDATGLAAGAYLCRLTAGGAIATRVVIIR